MKIEVELMEFGRIVGQHNTLETHLRMVIEAGCRVLPDMAPFDMPEPMYRLWLAMDLAEKVLPKPPRVRNIDEPRYPDEENPG